MLISQKPLPKGKMTVSASCRNICSGTLLSGLERAPKKWRTAAAQGLGWGWGSAVEQRGGKGAAYRELQNVLRGVCGEGVHQTLQLDHRVFHVWVWDKKFDRSLITGKRVQEEGLDDVQKVWADGCRS